MSGHHYRRPISLTEASQAKPLCHQLRLAQPPPPPSLIAGTELLLPPFRPSLSLPPPSTTLSGCALLGNIISYRRSHLPATGEPVPRSPSSLPPLGSKNHQKAAVETLHLLWRRSRGLKPRSQTVGRKTRHNLILRSKCRSSHPTPQRVQWSEPHYSLDLHKHAAH
uniref:Uncharacterized protein n=1 Tax=Oryza barthii TaxID=65489 RepID=A0A0D3F4L7_9ORYZ